MSTSPYSLDLRERVISYIERGNTQVSAASLFCLNLSTVNRWYLRYRREGHYKPRRNVGAKLKIDVEGLRSFISLNPDSRLKDLSVRFGVSSWTIYQWLKKLGFSYKKKPSAMWKQARRSELDI